MSTPGPLALLVVASGPTARFGSRRAVALHAAAGRILLDRVLSIASSLASVDPSARVHVLGGEEVLARAAEVLPGALLVPWSGGGRGTVSEAARAALGESFDAARVLVLSAERPLVSLESAARLVPASRGLAEASPETLPADESLTVTDRRSLAAADAALRTLAAARAMDAGATLVRPESITLDVTVELAADCVVSPFVTLTGSTRVGEGARVGQGCIVSDSEIGPGAEIRPYSVIDRSVIGAGAIVGPFARLREGTDLGEGVHVGNFVETKKARLGRGAKANHLTYLGDAEIGERTNVGAGVITCNFDGVSKHRTTIGADAFIGSDVQLVAPVTVGNRALVAAGTTLTQDVPDEALALSRTPQRVIEGLGAATIRKKRAQKAAAGQT